MAPKHKSLLSLSSLLILISLLCILSLFFIFSKPSPPSLNYQNTLNFPDNHLKVFIFNLPRSLNYGLLDKYWSLTSDSRLGSEVDNEIRATHVSKNSRFSPYPESPLIKQYSAEYWLMGDLITPERLRIGSFAKRVSDVEDADVVFVPFFATLSAELQLGVGKGVFKKKVGNEDYDRQKEVIDLVKNSESWKRSGGRDHVFVLTGYVKS